LLEKTNSLIPRQQKYSNSKVNKCEEVINVTTAGTATKKISNNKPKKNSKSNDNLEKFPGDKSFPVNCFSVTVTKNGGDIQTEYLDIMDNFLKQHCLRGAFSLEVGTRAFNLHLQVSLNLDTTTTTKQFRLEIFKISIGLHRAALSKFAYIHQKLK
jgi:hypothetical protein